MPKQLIYISYAHRDQAFKDQLRSHLRLFEDVANMEIWDDRTIDAGDRWFDELRKVLENASVAILLVSADFLASPSIQSEEIPFLLRRRAEEGLFVLPILVRPAAWHLVSWLHQIQMWPRDARALSELSNTERDRSFAELTEFLQGVLHSRSSPKEGPLRPWPNVALKSAQELPAGVEFFICHDHEDGDFAELLKLRIESEGHTAWIDTERLNVGEDWRVEIDHAIKAASALLVINTPVARQSEYVTYEWAYALGVGTRVVPIMLKQTQLHPRLETLQYLDFTNRLARPWSRLMTALSEAKAAKD